MRVLVQKYSGQDCRQHHTAWSVALNTFGPWDTARPNVRTRQHCPQGEQAQADTRRVVAAFVTFREEAGKAACLAAQPRSRMRQWLTLKPQHRLRGRWAAGALESGHLGKGVARQTRGCSRQPARGRRAAVHAPAMAPGRRLPYRVDPWLHCAQARAED